MVFECCVSAGRAKSAIEDDKSVLVNDVCEYGSEVVWRCWRDVLGLAWWEGDNVLVGQVFLEGPEPYVQVTQEEGEEGGFAHTGGDFSDSNKLKVLGISFDLNGSRAHTRGSMVPINTMHLYWVSPCGVS